MLLSKKGVFILTLVLGIPCLAQAINLGGITDAVKAKTDEIKTKVPGATTAEEVPAAEEAQGEVSSTATQAASTATSNVTEEKGTGVALTGAKRDAAAKALLNKFFKALSISDFEASIKACKPMMHKSLYNAQGNDISPDLRRFGFKKAHDGAKFYTQPVNITRVRETSMSGVGFGDTAEAGQVVDYFVGKKDGVGGMPAPVKVFFPSNGNPAKIFYIGSI